MAALHEDEMTPGLASMELALGRPQEEPHVPTKPAYCIENRGNVTPVFGMKSDFQRAAHFMQTNGELCGIIMLQSPELFCFEREDCYKHASNDDSKPGQGRPPDFSKLFSTIGWAGNFCAGRFGVVRDGR